MSLKFILTVLIVSLSGFQFGYNTVVIAGALEPLKMQFGWTLWEESFAVSSVLVGGLIGALVSSYLSNRFGRKMTLIFTTLIFFISSLGTGFASTTLLFFLGRIVQGIAVGLVSAAAPLYLGEVSPPGVRGVAVSCNQLAITVGALAAYGSALLYSDVVPMMFILGMIPAGLQCLGLLFLQESVSTDVQNSSSWAEVFQPRYRSLLIVGVLIAFAQQVTGINAVVYFAPEIFRQAGLTAGSTALLATFGLGAVNVLATTISILLIDRLGRRPLLFAGLAGMALSFLWFIWGSWTESSSLVPIASLMTYIAMFAIGMGAVPWVVISEIYPKHIRAQSIAVATFMSWVGNIVVAYTFLDIAATLTTSGAFLIYALMCLLFSIYFYKKLPETKGISLEI